MSARELVQQRITLANGDTKWNNSILIEAAIRGDLLVLDGIHRIKDDTLMSIRRLIQDREIDLLDGRKLMSAERYDSLLNETKRNNLNIESSVLRIHPSFRIIATAEPPVGKASFKEKDDVKPSSNPTTPNIQIKSANNEWLNSEVLNLFLYQHVEALDLNYEYEIISKKFKLNKKHEKLLDLMEQLFYASCWKF
jgi:MoxR-like ATPase